MKGAKYLNINRLNLSVTDGIAFLDFVRNHK
jgi:hypothetical protein